jgi:hypothetical protein
MKNFSQHSVAALPTCSIDEVRDLPVIHVWHATEPSAAALFRCSRAHSYRAAARGEIPIVAIGRRLYVPVPALLKMLGADGAPPNEAA